jgi:hypothetical protein
MYGAAMPVFCIECKYDLTATPRDSRCPECGQLAQESYDAAEKPPPPLHDDALSAIAACCAGALSVSIFAVTVVTANSLGLFGMMLTIFHASPFGFMMAYSYLHGRHSSSASTFLWMSLILMAFTWGCYFYIMAISGVRAVPMMSLVPLGGLFVVFMSRAIVKRFT